MRILGAIEFAQGRTSIERIKNVSKLIFTDEDGNPRKFTWRTISTWLYRYKSQGVTGISNKPRKDKDKPRKVSPEELLEAINSALPYFRDNLFTNRDIYRFCIEKGFIRKEQLRILRPEFGNATALLCRICFLTKMWESYGELLKLR